MSLSTSLAEQMWLGTLERGSDQFRVAVTKGLSVLASDEPDWLINALHQVHWARRNNVADAVAYVVLCSILKREQVFLCFRPCQSWAHPNSADEANQASLVSAGLVGRFNSTSQGPDGFVRPDPPLPMSQLYIHEDMSPVPAPIAFEDSEGYTLEVGACSMSKSVAILATTGRLARLPYKIPFDVDPGIFFLRMSGQTFAPGF